MVSGGCVFFAGESRFPKEEAALGNHSAQSPASARVASPGHAMGHCKVNCSLRCVPQGWCGLHWGLRQGRAGGLWGLQFCRFVELSRGGGSTRQPQRTEPCQCVSGQPWAYYGALKGKIQPLQCAANMKRPTLAAAAGRSRWFMGVAVLPLSGDFIEEEAALGNHSAQSPAIV